MKKTVGLQRKGETRQQAKRRVRRQTGQIIVAEIEASLPQPVLEQELEEALKSEARKRREFEVNFYGGENHLPPHLKSKF